MYNCIDINGSILLLLEEKCVYHMVKRILLHAVRHRICSGFFNEFIYL